MWPEDLRIIYGRLNNLNTDHGFPDNARPYIYQEVIDYGGEAISRDEYTPFGAVTEFKVGAELSNCFRGHNALRWLVNWGPQWGLLASGDALTFIDNHDNERGHGGGGGVLNYKDGKPYRAAMSFILAHPYGEPQIMSSFTFWDSEVGPPMDAQGNIISPSINSVSYLYHFKMTSKLLGIVCFLIDLGPKSDGGWLFKFKNLRMLLCTTDLGLFVWLLHQPELSQF